MSAALTEQLYKLYTSQLYRTLFVNCPEYQQSLQRVGLIWNSESKIPTKTQDAFEKEMKLWSWLHAIHIHDQKSLEMSSIKARLLSGPQKLYRVSSRSSESIGIWWFTEKVAQRCRDFAGRDPNAQLDWLRNVLAVCFNFSSFDQFQCITLGPCEELPIVYGKGLPMPYYLFKPFVHRETGEHLIKKFPNDYWIKKGEILFGGEAQIVLPWVPAKRVRRLDVL